MTNPSERHALPVSSRRRSRGTQAHEARQPPPVRRRLWRIPNRPTTMEVELISGTLSIRHRRGVLPPLRAPLRQSATAAADAIMARAPARPVRVPTAPVVPPTVADQLRKAVPSQSFIDTFDALLDRQKASDPNPMVRPADRTVLRFLLGYRWCATRPTTHEIAQRLGREERFVWQSVNRLQQCNLLPWGDRL